jgi:hypothetical protein
LTRRAIFVRKESDDVIITIYRRGENESSICFGRSSIFLPSKAIVQGTYNPSRPTIGGRGLNNSLDNNFSIGIFKYLLRSRQMDIQMQHFGRLLRGFYPHLIISNQFSNDTKLNSLYPLCERDVFFHQPFLEGKSMRKIIFSVCATALCLSVCAGSAAAAYMKMDPPPDADKAFLAGNNSCWLATAANMLAGAGYGVGATVQARANNINANLTAHYGTANGGWADTALTWWLSSAHNTWPANPYDVVTVYGNKTRNPWANANGAQFIGNELRRCQMLGLSISWPRTSAGGSAYGGHAIACWGDSGGNAVLAGNPAQVIVVDSDRDTGGNVQTYTYDVYTHPTPQDLTKATAGISTTAPTTPSSNTS